jgi:hypothetical protein
LKSARQKYVSVRYVSKDRAKKEELGLYVVGTAAPLIDKNNRFAFCPSVEPVIVEKEHD